MSSADFSPDTSQVLTASYDGTANLWDTESGECVQMFEGLGRFMISAVCSPDSSKIITASSDGTAKLWDTESGKCVQTFHGHEGIVKSAIFMRITIPGLAGLSPPASPLTGSV
jgi:WD40 repeat protein